MKMGLQLIKFNTLFQLYAMKYRNLPILSPLRIKFISNWKENQNEAT